MIHLNFGWLNDYSGSKFAPYTLADKVLLNTSNNTTESFFDYVKNQNLILDEGISGNLSRIKQLREEMDGLILDEQALEKEGITRQAVYQARALVTAPNELLVTGNSQLPVYFDQGVPVVCANINDTPNSFEEDPMSQWDNYIVQGWDQDGKVLYLDHGPFTKTLVSASNALSINISGAANYAARAEEAKMAIAAEVARNAYRAENAFGLSYDIQLGTNEEKEDIGDIVGTIYTYKTRNETTSGPNNSCGGILHSALNLRAINNFTGGSIKVGGQIASNITQVEIPVITVDNTGRITDINKHQWSPQLNILNIQNTTDRGTNTIFPVVTAVGTNNAGWTYYNTTTNNTSDGVYIECSPDTSSKCILMGAAWNDYAEYRAQSESIEPGYCVYSNDEGIVRKTTQRLESCDGIVSDTFGFSIGKTQECQTPLAVAGRVLAYYNGNKDEYHSGDAVCAGENGKIVKMTSEEISKYPHRIIGTVSEIPTYEYWHNTKVNDRIWIKVK